VLVSLGVSSRLRVVGDIIDPVAAGRNAFMYENSASARSCRTMKASMKNLNWALPFARFSVSRTPWNWSPTRWRRRTLVETPSSLTFFSSLNCETSSCFMQVTVLGFMYAAMVFWASAAVANTIASECTCAVVP